MEINATLLGQMITFLILVFITLKFIWPPLIKILKDRREAISLGLAASEQAHHELELAKKRAKEVLLEAKSQAVIIIEQANLRAHQIQEESREEARQIALRIKSQAEIEIEKFAIESKQALLEQAAEWVIAGTEKLIRQKINPESNQVLMASITQDLNHL